MKKIISVIIALALAATAAAALSSCGKSDSKTIKIGASVTPHAEILREAAKILEKEGYTLEIIEFNDYVQPNTQLEDGQLDANYFQHRPYMNNFNEENGTHIVSAVAVHYEPFGIYAGKTASIEALADGATVAIPNDGTNEARALKLLEAQGLIKLKADAGFTATVLDIAENPKNLDIKEIEAAQLARSLQDVDIAVINGNYAIEAGLNASTDALAIEDPGSESAQTYANVVSVKEGHENDEGIKALVAAITSNEVRDYIVNTYNGAVVPIF